MPDLNAELDAGRLSWSDWDWWPLARLLIVGAALGIAAHIWLGWTPDIARLAALPQRAFGALSLLALASFTLARFYVLGLMLPLYAAVVLNDALYALSKVLCRSVLRFRPGPTLEFASLCGEIILFGFLVAALRHRLVRL